MKRILLMLMALSMIFCFVGCKDSGDGEKTTTTATTINTEINNKIAEAKLDIDNIVLCLSTYAEYDRDLGVDADDTIGDVLKKFEDDGSYVEIFHIDTNAKFFDYVTENPNYAPGGSLYLLREDADWLSLYVD